MSLEVLLPEGGDLRDACLAHAQSSYPQADAELLDHQGGCSVTILLTLQSKPKDEDQGSRHIIQYRPAPFQIKPEVAATVHAIHGLIVPKVLNIEWLQIGLTSIQMVAMPLLAGTAFSTIQCCEPSLGSLLCYKLGNLLDDLAEVFSKSWYAGSSKAACTGRVGASFHSRLQHLSKDLPAHELREVAQSLLLGTESRCLEILPQVMTHGDLVPSNMLVDQQSWRLKGLVDWAEAETLPFGIALYGLEHLLGYGVGSDDQYTFTYYAEAAGLRERFWRRMLQLIPALTDPILARAVLLARDIGVLLWHGFAWDDGKIDRVIDAKNDPEELTKLAVFLSSSVRQQPLHNAQELKRSSSVEPNSLLLVMHG